MLVTVFGYAWLDFLLLMLFQGLQTITKFASGHNMIEVEGFVGNNMIAIIFPWVEAVDIHIFCPNFTCLLLYLDTLVWISCC